MSSKQTMPWFRFYGEVLGDPKLATLTDAQFRVWVNLLCLASTQVERGVIADHSEKLLAALVAHRDIDLLRETLAELVDLRIITHDEGTITFTNFEKRQYDKPSDKPERVAARVAAHRQRQRNADVTPCNAIEEEVEEDADADRDAETEDLKSKDTAVVAASRTHAREEAPPAASSDDDDGGTGHHPHAPHLTLKRAEPTPTANTTRSATRSTPASDEAAFADLVAQVRAETGLPDSSNLRANLRKFLARAPAVDIVAEAGNIADWARQQHASLDVRRLSKLLERKFDERATQPARPAHGGGVPASTTEPGAVSTSGDGRGEGRGGGRAVAIHATTATGGVYDQFVRRGPPGGIAGVRAAVGHG